MNLDLWKEKTKGLFHIVEWTKFWNYIDNLKKDTINEVLRKDYDSCVKDLKKSEKKREKLEEENQRLNNVLNELEKWLIEDNYKNEDVWCITTQEVLKKINELKESDK